MHAVPPSVTVVIATKNRPAMLFRLLDTVRRQEHADFECIVVDDGSDPDARRALEHRFAALDARFRLVLRSASGGPSVSRNAGIRLARGDYIALCDDDDFWTRTDHLATAVRTMRASRAELYFADMQTCVNGAVRTASWYAPLAHVRRRAPVAGEHDVYRLREADLVRLLRFKVLHANTLVVAKALFERIGLYWEKISFAEDHDLSFRLVDAARGVLYRHCVAATQDLTPHDSLAKAYVQRERNLFGIMAVHNAQISIRSRRLRRVCKANRAWRLVELARRHLADGERSAARELATEAFLLRPSKTSTLLLLRSLAGSRRLAACMAAGALGVAAFSAAHD